MRDTAFTLLFIVFCIAAMFIVGVWLGWESVSGDCLVHGHFTYSGHVYRCEVESRGE